MALQRNLAQAFDSIPEAKFSYKPTPAQQTIGYIAQHLANDNYFFCNEFGAMKATRPAKDTATPDSVKAKWPKDTLVAKLKASFAFCENAFAQLDDAKLADQVTMTFGGNSRQVPRAQHGARPRTRHGGSLQPARELHAPEQHAPADGAAEAGDAELARECVTKQEGVPRGTPSFYASASGRAALFIARAPRRAGRLRRPRG